MTGQTVRDVMTPEVVVVAPECGYKHIVDVLADFRVSAVPVVEGETVIGMVSEADLLHKLEFSDDGAHVWRMVERHSRRVAREKAGGTTARALMSSPVVTIGSGDSLAAAARTMEQHHVKRLPVVDDGRLVGIVARGDLLRRYLRPDADIKRDIVLDVLRRRMSLDPTEVRVLVGDGQVTLRGRTDRRSTAILAGRLVAGVDGVVTVVNELTWRCDDLSTMERRQVLDTGVRC